MKESEKPWIEIGYRFFAEEGPTGLKIERMSKALNKSKSSFYHFFADLHVFTGRLLTYHLAQAKSLGDKEANAQNEAELIKILLEYKVDLLFNRQLRINRENPAFAECFLKTNDISLPSVLPVWKKIIGLSENTSLAQMVLHLSLENFYLQITEETLTETWLKAYFLNIRQMVSGFKGLKKSTAIDGSV